MSKLHVRSRWVTPLNDIANGRLNLSLSHHLFLKENQESDKKVATSRENFLPGFDFQKNTRKKHKEERKEETKSYPTQQERRTEIQYTVVEERKKTKNYLTQQERRAEIPY
jgi:hypothetical protein